MAFFRLDLKLFESPRYDEIIPPRRSHNEWVLRRFQLKRLFDTSPLKNTGPGSQSPRGLGDLRLPLFPRPPGPPARIDAVNSRRDLPPRPLAGVKGGREPFGIELAAPSSRVRGQAPELG